MASVVNAGVAPRAAVGVPLAFLVTAGLFLFMRTLVAPPDTGLEEDNESVTIEIGRRERDENVRNQERTKPDRPEAVEPPPPPPSRAELEQDTSLDGVNIELPDFAGVDTAAALNTDSTVQPLVRINPQYPERAASRGVEGSTQVCFDVTEEGTTVNVRVVAEEPRGYFGRASERAVERWKYKPKIQDGRPVPRRNICTQLSFQLADE